MDHIDNRTGFTDRSVRSLFVWAWGRVRPGLTPGQREAANYGGASFEVCCDGGRRAVGSRWINLKTNHDPAADDKDFGWSATAFWRHRAGLKHAWFGDETEGVEAPKLALPAARKPRAETTRDKLHATNDLAARKVTKKKEHLGRLRKKKRSAEAAARTATRRIAQAVIALAELELDADRAHTSMLAATKTAHLSAIEYAERMKAKREQASTPPPVR